MALPSTCCPGALSGAIVVLGRFARGVAAGLVALTLLVDAPVTLAVALLGLLASAGSSAA
jgi:hypothetical protein